MNNKVSYLLHGFSFVLIIVLFMLTFSKKGDPQMMSTTQSKQHDKALLFHDTTHAAGLPIAFINTDTVINNLDYYHALTKSLETKQRQLENELNQKARAYQAKEQDFIEQQNKGLLLRTEQQQIYERLMLEQQQLMELREKMAMELAEMEQVTYRRIVNRITGYLKNTYEGQYRFIFGLAFGGNILYGDPGFDITQEVIEGINQLQ